MCRIDEGIGVSVGLCFTWCALRGGPAWGMWGLLQDHFGGGMSMELLPVSLRPHYENSDLMLKFIPVLRGCKMSFMP